ncbi:fungal-specific transcription factor domain-containing protein [Dichotomocladium elegans]|nr:fungal-specific transcription factor domain-containing protein [Dichotomocladium elegans]
MEKMLSRGNDPNSASSPSHSDGGGGGTSPHQQHHQQHGRSASMNSNVSFSSSLGGGGGSSSSAGIGHQTTGLASVAPSATVGAQAHVSSSSHSARPMRKGSLLPSPDIVQHLVQLFFDCIFHYMAIFDKESFMRDVHEQRVPDFLLLSMLSVAARYSDRSDIREDPPWNSGEKYAVKARSILFEAIDTPSLANVQALLLLTLHEYGCARGPRSWMYSGMAIRMALELGLNKDIDLEESSNRTMSVEQWTNAEIQRRVFWTTFTVDKFLSASTGRPSILQEEDCEVLLPIDKYDELPREHYTESVCGDKAVVFNVHRIPESNILNVTITVNTPTLISSTTGKKYQMCCLAYMYRAGSLLGRVTAFINRKSRQRKLFCVDGPGPEFIAIDREIDAWCQDLPLELKDTPENDQYYQDHIVPDSSRFMLLHILYNTLIVLLHRPSLALLDTLSSENVQPHLKESVTANAAKCLMAVEKVTDLIIRIKDRKRLISPFISYLTYTVATITVNGVFFGKPEEMQKAKNALVEHFEVLQAMRTHWAMADKLYFMIRDLYAMHANYMRQQQQQAAKKVHSGSQCWHNGTEQQSSPIPNHPTAVAAGPQQQGSVGRLQWPALSNAHTPLIPVPGVAQTTTADIMNTNRNELQLAFNAPSTLTENAPVRGMSLADLSLSSCDGASCTDWIVGDNSKNIAAAMQSLSRATTPGGLNNMFDFIGASAAFTPDTPWPFDFSNMTSDSRPG